ncbi:MAG: hypothetical protein HQ568_03090, partial [Calditrichaeota bacterium]|nr:hypothetical protein [Calditrichota bacterium]
MKFEFKHYKHYLLAFAVVFVATQVCVAQIEFTEHTIAGNFDRAVSVYAEDIDGDGDMDVLGASPSAGDITWWESDLNPGRILRGCVFDAENDSLLEGVEVATSHGFSTQSDTAGFWCLERVGSDSFNITFSKSGYNDSTLIDQHVEYEDTLEINIGLLHPELLLSEAEIVDELEYGGSAEHNLTIQNDGNGPLEWSVKPRLVGESCVDPWEMRQSQVIGNTLEDSRLQGVVFINDQYYVSGGGNDTNMIYVLDREGHEVDRFAQPGDSRYGMKDLAWDGELIWGCSDNMVIGFNTEGDSVTAFEGPEYDLSAIAWDSDREVFWVGRKTGRGIYGCDIEGNCQDTLSRCDLRLYGLAYWQDDPDGYNLYILHCPDNETQVVHKMNTETGDTMFVALLEPEEGGSPGGAFITNTYYPRCWVFVNITNDPDGDRIDIWQVDGNTSWMTLEPMTGDIESQASQDLTLSIFTEGLLAPDW